MSSTESTTGRAAGRTTGSRRSWRVVDIVTCAVVGVAAGVALWAFGIAFRPAAEALGFLQPLSAILNGGFLFPAVLGALVVRRPGAAFFAEVLAGLTSMLIGTEWGIPVIIWAAVQGLAAEAGFALLRYRRWGLPAALLAGACAGLAVGLMDTTFYYPAWEAGYKVLYVALSIPSGVVLAGLLAHLVVRALARTGALSALPSGRSGERV